MNDAFSKRIDCEITILKKHKQTFSKATQNLLDEPSRMDGFRRTPEDAEVAEALPSVGPVVAKEEQGKFIQKVSSSSTINATTTDNDYLLKGTLQISKISKRTCWILAQQLFKI